MEMFEYQGHGMTLGVVNFVWTVNRDSTMAAFETLLDENSIISPIEQRGKAVYEAY